MTGQLTTLTNIHNIIGFNFYTKDENGEEVIFYKEIIKLQFENLINFKRRALLYPYLPVQDEDPFIVGYFQGFSAIKIFVPANIIKIAPLNLEGEEFEDVYGLFYDPFDVDSLFEYSIDKYVVLLESNLGEDLTKFFITLHENDSLDAHREDFEIIPKNIYEPSIVNKYLIQASYNTNIANNLNNGYILGNDFSFYALGEHISFFKTNDAKPDMYIYNKGVLHNDLLINSNYSINLLGNVIDTREDLHLSLTPLYAKWLKKDNAFTKENGQWGKFKWKPSN